MADTGITFFRAAGRVRRRLILVAWLRLMNRTALPLFVMAAAALAAVRLLGLRWSNVPLTLLAVGVWIALLWCLAWVRRPSPVGALSVWDRRRQRQCMFMSAYCFEQDHGEGDTGRELHLRRSHALLAREWPRLRTDFPLPRPLALLCPAMLITFVVSGMLERPLAIDRQGLDADAVARTHEAGAELASHRDKLDTLKGLNAAEREDVNRFAQQLDATLRKLERVDGEDTARDVIETLEQRAREAEALSEQLGGDPSALSHAFVAEMARHADLAELAAAQQADDLAGQADALDALATHLAAEQLSMEERKRIEDAMQRALESSTEADRTTPLGKALTEAADALQQKQPVRASRSLRKAATSYARRNQRRKQQRRLRRLAKRLRRSGSRVLGHNQAGKLQRLQSPAGRGQPLGQASVSSLPVSSFMNVSQARMTSGPMGSMTNRPTAFGTGLTPVPGGSHTGRLAHAGSVPVPGAPLGGATPGGSAAAGAAAGAGAGLGGLQAGHGSAPYVPTTNALFAATHTERVVAADSGHGDASRRTVLRAPHARDVADNSKALMIAFVKAEEEAMNEEPLPPSRRGQVIRYFKEVRRRLEDER